MENSTSIENSINILFSWYDYILFVLVLLISAIIGVYFGFFAKQKQTSANQYLYAGKNMNVAPVTLSLVASLVSGSTIMGIPTEIYRYGSTYIFSILGGIGLIYISYKVYIPVFFKLQIISTYEYLELRFNKHMRILTSAISTIAILLHMPMIIYAPAIAVAQATGASVHSICWLISIVCIFYTTLGGLKAVVWSDVLQFVLMVGAVIVLLIMGIFSVGGVEEIINRAYIGDRLTYDIRIDPRIKDTVWTYVIGIQFYYLGSIGLGQASVQKYLALPSMLHVKKALCWFGVGFYTITFISIATGVVMYAQYAFCDPISNGKIERHDQISIYFAMELSQTVPGLASLYIAGVASAALSTLSATMNSLSGIVYEDFISPFMSENISQKTVSTILKILVVIIGIVGTVLALLFDKLEGAIIPIQISLMGITTGALIGLFSLGMLVPMANAKGAIAGAISSIVSMAIIIIKNQMYQFNGLINRPVKPISTEGCPNYINTTVHIIEKSASPDEEPIFIFHISHWYYVMMGTFIVFLVGIPISYLTKSDNEKSVSRDLISPVMHWCLNNKTLVDNSYCTEEEALKNVNKSKTEEFDNNKEECN